jgi:transcriptional regulator with XRE-family HTH domain
MSLDVRKLVGSNVRRLQIAAGISQATLAERVGVDRAYISGLELGQRNATIISLWHVSEALAVNFSSLFENEKRSKPSR